MKVQFYFIENVKILSLCKPDSSQSVVTAFEKYVLVTLALFASTIIAFSVKFINLNHPLVNALNRQPFFQVCRKYIFVSFIYQSVHFYFYTL